MTKYRFTRKKKKSVLYKELNIHFHRFRKKVIITQLSEG